MIVKVVPKSAQPQGTRGFRGLVRYIEQNAEWLQPSGIESAELEPNDVDLHIREVEAHHSLNKRSRRDKTMHIVASFAPHEKPTREQLADIEAHLVQSLGYEGHPRISGYHTNEEHPHLHIAVSMLDPLTHTRIDPHQSHRKLREAATELEQKHGLVRTEWNKEKHRDTRLSRYSQDFEARHGLKSFERWAKEEVGPALVGHIKSGEASWKSVHALMAKHDLELRLRGAGLVVANRSVEKQFVAASSMSRLASLKQLEAKLGPFQAPEPGQAAELRYKPSPLDWSKEQSSALWGEYTVYREAAEAGRGISPYAAKSAVWAEYERVKDGIRFDRSLSGERRKAAYRGARLAYLEGVAAAKALPATQPQTWSEWLRDQALNGNEEALKKLREANERNAMNVRDADIQTITRVAEVSSQVRELGHSVSVSVDRKGLITYSAGDSKVFDDGKRIYTHSESDEAARLASAVAVSSGLDASQVRVQGDKAFQELVARGLSAQPKKGKGAELGPSRGD